MHEEHHCQASLDDCNGQHAQKHMRRVNMLIGNDELQARQSQQANINDQVVLDSITLALGSWHSIPLPVDLVREIQKVDERYDEHPDQIHEVPVKAQNLDIIGIVASAPIAH